MVSCSAGIRILFVGALELFVSALNKPNTLPNWQIIGFGIGKTYIIHQDKDLLEINLFIIRCQAKKS